MMSIYTTEDAARELHTTSYTVRKYIRCGKLAAAKIGKKYLITEETLILFIKEKTIRQPVQVI